MKRQKLLPKAIQRLLPALGETSALDNNSTKVSLKLFNPVGAGSWFVTEVDPESKMAFGYVTGLGCDELGYIDIAELEEIRLPYGFRIERDIFWDPTTTLGQVMRGERT